MYMQSEFGECNINCSFVLETAQGIKEFSAEKLGLGIYIGLSVIDPIVWFIHEVWGAPKVLFVIVIITSTHDFLKSIIKKWFKQTTFAFLKGSSRFIPSQLFELTEHKERPYPQKTINEVFLMNTIKRLFQETSNCNCFDQTKLTFIMTALLKGSERSDFLIDYSQSS